MKPYSELRILEFGEEDVFNYLLPEGTTRYGASPSREKNKKARPFTFAEAIKLWRDMSGNPYDVVSIAGFKKPVFSRHFSLKRNVSSFFKYLRCPSGLGIYLGIFLARRHKVPILVFDSVDTMLIEASSFFTLSVGKAYFKRELPQNNWHAFLGTTPRNGDVSNIRRQPFFAENMPKVKPFPLHLGQSAYEFEPVDAGQKQFDIFYAGDNPKTTVRTSGFKVLQKMRYMGFQVDLPQERLTSEEFFKRIKSSWLVWSPEGSGWECHRHYETLVNGAVPLMNYPTIHRYKPLIHGVHGLYYGCEADDLIRVAVEALKDKQGLLKMVEQGREHLQSFYTKQKVLDYIFAESGLSGK
jgi:hypothetical protein